MKFFLLILVFLFSLTGFSQSTSDNYFGRSSPRITKHQLDNVKVMSEILPGYTNLVDYVTVKISVNEDGNIVSAGSYNEILTEEQKCMLRNADLCSDIDIKVQFNYKDSVFDNYGNGKKLKEMTFSLYVTPDIEADYPDGREKATQFLSASVMSNITDTIAAKKLWNAVVKFTINEKGEVKDAKIVQTSSDPKIDEWLLEATAKMRNWKPAELKKGGKVEQKVSISVGGGLRRKGRGGC